MMRRRKTSRNQALDETRQRPAAVESANEGYDEASTNPISRTAGYVKWDNINNPFSGIQAVMAAFVEAWQRRKSRRS